MKILDIFIDKLNLNAGESTAFDVWLGEIRRDGRTLSSVTTSTGGGAGVNAGNVVISLEDGVTLFNPDTGARTIYLDPDGDASFGDDIDNPGDTALKIFSNAQTYNDESMGEGDALFGDNSTSKSNIHWDKSTGQIKLRSGTTAGIILDTDGTIIVGASAPNIIIDGVNKNIRSSNYSAGAAGFQVEAASGNAEFNNITARGMFRASVFQVGQVSAVGGSLLVSKNSGVIYTNVTTPAVSSTYTLYVETDDNSNDILEVNDKIHVQAFSGSDISETWGTVDAVLGSSADYTWYTITCEWGGNQVLQKGMAVVNYGPSGAGIIHLQAGALTTRMRIATHAGSPWEAGQTNKVVLGNMRGTYGTGANDRYGIGIGDYDAKNYLSYNAETADALRIVAADGSITLGGSGLRARITAGGNVTVQIDADGDAFFGSNIGAPATTAFVVFANAQTYNTESVGAGDVLLGDNSANKANLLWDKSEGELLFRSGQTSKVKIGTDGILDANTVQLGGARGMLFKGSTGDIRSITWAYFDDPDYRNIGEIFGDYGGSGDAIVWVRSLKAGGDPWTNTGVVLIATDDIGGDTRVHVVSDGNVYLYGDLETSSALSGSGHIKAVGDIYTVGWTDYSATSSITGWTTYTTKKIYYKKVGNLVKVWYRIQGVSNHAETKFTLPYSNNAGIRAYHKPTRTRNNGTWGSGAAYGMMVESEAIVRFFITEATTGYANWVATGNKDVFGWFEYEAA